MLTGGVGHRESPPYHIPPKCRITPHTHTPPHAHTTHTRVRGRLAPPGRSPPPHTHVRGRLRPPQVVGLPRAVGLLQALQHRVADVQHVRGLHPVHAAVDHRGVQVVAQLVDEVVEKVVLRAHDRAGPAGGGGGHGFRVHVASDTGGVQVKPPEQLNPSAPRAAKP